MVTIGRRGVGYAATFTLTLGCFATPAPGQVVDFLDCGIDCDLGGKVFLDVPLTVTNTPNPTSVITPGGNVTFTVHVRNRSASLSADLVLLEDNLFGDVTNTGNPALTSTSCTVPHSLNADDLAAGGPDEYTCSFGAFVGGGAGSLHSNTLTAHLFYNPNPTPNLSVGVAEVAVLGTTAYRGTTPATAGLGPGGPGGPIPTTGALAPPEEDVVFTNVDASGMTVTVRGGADLRIYATGLYASDPTVTGQALIDFSWPEGLPANRQGTIFEFNGMARKFCLIAGDFGSDDDGNLQLQTFLGPTPGQSAGTPWDETENPPFALMELEDPGGFDSVVFKSGGSFPNSVFLDAFSFVPFAAVGPPGVPDGTLGAPMRVAKTTPCNGNVCTPVAPSDCCLAAPAAAGCSDPICEAYVCGQDPTCCGVLWDSSCVDLALARPDCVAGCQGLDCGAPAPCPVEITWDTFSCCEEADDHHLVFGVGSDLPSYVLTNKVCNIGAAPPYAWNDPTDPKDIDADTRLIWWLILASKNLNEGSWGTDSADVERSSPSTSCEPKSLGNLCGHVP